MLGDCYYSGNIVPQNYTLAKYMYDILNLKHPSAIKQYKTRQSGDFKIKTKKQNDTFVYEISHLDKIINYISLKIDELNGNLECLGETWWMDYDQLSDWKEKSFKNYNIEIKINLYEKIKKCPYYARMDSMCNGYEELHYIGEEDFFDYENNLEIVSAWSEYGKKYRAKNEINFKINNYEYDVLLRRNIYIKNSVLIEVIDEYDVNNFEITDPFLVKILEEKKQEHNITNIIRSIQIKQNDIIEYDFNSNLIIQGCAGSGKTMILLHRLANMKYNIQNLNLSKIKILTPNRNFNLYFDDLSENLHIEKIEKLTLAEYWLEIILRYREQNGLKAYNLDEIANLYKNIYSDLELDFKLIFLLMKDKTYQKYNMNYY